MIIISNWIGNLLILSISILFMSICIFVFILCLFAIQDMRKKYEFVGFKKIMKKIF